MREQCKDQTDEELIVRVPTDREVFGCLIERYEDKLRRYVRRLMPGLGEDTDDLLQEIFIKVYVHARGFDSSLKFSSWVYRIAHNEAVSWLRKRKARPQVVELGEDEFKTFIESIEDSSVREDTVLLKDAVARTLAEMDEKYRTVLVLKFLEGKSYEEIGDILTVPGGTVATLVHRAKKQFMSIYQDHHA
ncbi:MAG: RNA polymerase sigma factor [Candidatus Pacebacteria bacterium]|nr:RNA polymerase sigma factor [Candidatus Paceibacterota bacterium]